MKRILVIKTGALGDIVRTSHILPGLIKKYKGAVIDWVVKSPGDQLLSFNPYIDKVIDIETCKGLRAHYDLVISLDDELESVSVIDRIKYKKVIGLHYKKYGLVYTSDASLWFDMGLVSRLGKTKADILKRKNVMSHREILENILDIDIHYPYFNNDIDAIKRVQKEYNPSVFNIGINPCAGERWKSKELQAREFYELINLLIINGKRIACRKSICINIYGISGRHEYIEVARMFNDSVIVRDTSESLQTFAAHIGQCDYFISSDSLALHLAISQNVPNCSFYSPTSAVEIETFGLGVKVLSLDSDYCSYRPDTNRASITADRIYNEVKEHIKFN